MTDTRYEARARWGPSSLAGLAGTLAVLLLAGPVTAQMVGPREATRPELQTMLDSLRQELARADDGDRRRELQNRVDGLQYRLEHGDVWPGDVVALQVLGEQKWTDTFSVSPQRTLELSAIDPITLDGVLYSEVEGEIATELSKYLREPRIDVQILKRIGILGEVSAPGFYIVKGNTLVSEAIMRAGGPSGNADIDDVEVLSQGRELSEGRPRVAFQSISLDQLGVRSGDEIYVPARSGLNAWKVFTGALGLAGSIAFLITRLSR